MFTLAGIIVRSAGGEAVFIYYATRRVDRRGRCADANGITRDAQAARRAKSIGTRLAIRDWLVITEGEGGPIYVRRKQKPPPK